MQPCFTDPNDPPTEQSIAEALGRAAPAWRSVFDRIHAEEPDLVETWNYYADGKSWLLKVSRQKKTVFWVSLEKGAFHLGFYFPDRLTTALLASGLSDERKAEIRQSKPTGKLRPVSLVFGPRRGLGDVMTLISLKKTLK